MKTMHEDWKGLVPPGKHEAVTRALCTAFGTTAAEEVTPLTGGGSSAIVLKLVVEGRPCVLRVIQHVHALNDPARQFACLRMAADGGISPHVYYTDAQDALSITDYVAAVPLQEHPGPLLVSLVDAIDAIQLVPTFPAFMNYLGAIDSFLDMLGTTGVLPERAIRQHLELYSRIQEAYPRNDPDQVSSHNDLNPRNILFDGRRLWVIDWETAFRNDRYADLANVANFFFRDEPEDGAPGADEQTLLRAYFGDGLNEYHSARFFLMRQVVHLFYATTMGLVAASGRPPGHAWDAGMDTPRLRDFHRLFAGDGMPLAKPEGMLLYAKVRFNEALHNMKSPRFEESLRLMAQPMAGHMGQGREARAKAWASASTAASP